MTVQIASPPRIPIGRLRCGFFVSSAAEAVGREGVIVGRVDVRQPRDDEQRKHEQLDRHHHVVRRGALPHPHEEQPRDRHHDRERRHVDEHRDAGEMGRALQQPVHRRIGAQQRGAIAGREPQRQMDPETVQQRAEVVAPGNRDGHIADRVLEDQVPADDPGDELAQRRVRVRICAARLGNHRCQLGVTQAGECAAHTQQQEGEDQRRPGPAADEVAGGIVLAGGRGADGAEDPRPDHGADPQHNQVAGAKRAFQAPGRVALGEEGGDRLAAE